MNDNQVGAVKDSLGIAQDEDLPPTKPVLCILYIAGVLCNGTAIMHRFAATTDGFADIRSHGAAGHLGVFHDEGERPAK